MSFAAPAFGWRTAAPSAAVASATTVQAPATVAPRPGLRTTSAARLGVRMAGREGEHGDDEEEQTGGHVQAHRDGVWGRLADGSS